MGGWSLQIQTRASSPRTVQDFRCFQCSWGEGPAEKLLLKVSLLCLALNSVFWRNRRQESKEKRGKKNERKGMERKAEERKGKKRNKKKGKSNETDIRKRNKSQTNMFVLEEMDV